MPFDPAASRALGEDAPAMAPLEAPGSRLPGLHGRRASAALATGLLLAANTAAAPIAVAQTVVAPGPSWGDPDGAPGVEDTGDDDVPEASPTVTPTPADPDPDPEPGPSAPAPAAPAPTPVPTPEPAAGASPP